MQFSKSDELDDRILQILKRDARATYSQIGEVVGLTRVAVKNRIQKMEDAGVIEGYYTRIRTSTVSNRMPFYAYIETKPECYDDICARLQKDAMVSQLYQLSGNNALLLICAARDKEARAQFGWRVRNSYEGIVSFSTKDIWKVVKGNILSDE